MLSLYKVKAVYGMLTNNNNQKFKKVLRPEDSAFLEYSLHL